MNIVRIAVVHTHNYCSVHLPLEGRRRKKFAALLSAGICETTPTPHTRTHTHTPSSDPPRLAIQPSNGKRASLNTTLKKENNRDRKVEARKERKEGEKRGG